MREDVKNGVWRWFFAATDRKSLAFTTNPVSFQGGLPDEI
jgi:hypothetical protein